MRAHDVEVPWTPDLAAEVTARYLTREQMLLVGQMFMAYPQRAAVLMSAHGGTDMEASEFARACLEIALRLQREGGGMS